MRADRNDVDALGSVSDREWGAVIDLTSHPVHAKRAAGQLTARHWIYISSGSVYTDFSKPEQVATARTVPPLEQEWMQDMSQYASAKVACENTYLGLGSDVTIIRPGLIGGEGDWTGRSGYYPWRFAHPTGQDVLVPDPSQPTAILDVRDLAAWIVHCIHEQVTGIFNAAGESTTLADVYRHCIELTHSPAAARAVDDEKLLAAEIQPWMGPRSLPLWVPDPKLRFMATLDCGPARAKGFRPRPLSETLAAALRYEEERVEPRQAGLTDGEEDALRQALG